MSGAYVKEFEKWLENDNETTDSAKITQSAMVRSIDLGGGEDNLPRRGSVSSVESLEVAGDTAPVLTDSEDKDCNSDDDAQIESEHCFEEEPPILEPVRSAPNYNQSCKALQEPPVMNVDSASPCKGKGNHQVFSSENNFGPKSVNMNNKCKQECEIKEVYQNDGNKVSDEFSSKKRGNIFDKLSAISEHADDAPPPLILIPSPEDLAASEEEGENVPIKLKNSPDFCAMEADSTSEILKSAVQDFYRKKPERPFVVGSQGDASIECDSTCMLGASPNVVSPGFASSVDTDDAGNQSDSQVFSREGMNEDATLESPQSGSLLSPSVVCGIKPEATVAKTYSWEQEECPTLEAAVTLKEEVDVEKVIEEPMDVLVEEPPVLSMSVPESVQILRRKRHTIDTVENIASSGKRKHNASTPPLTPELGADNNTVKPPELVIQEDSSDKMALKQSSKPPKSSKKLASNASKKNRHAKYKKRSRSYSLVDSRKFIKRSTELSHLQSQMHKLVSLLFPQIKLELDGMTPESLQFENVLKDLTSASSQVPVDDTPNNSELCEISVTDIDDPYSSKCFQTCTDHQPLLSCNSLCAASFHQKESDIISVKHSSFSATLSGSCKEPRQPDDQKTSETMIPQLSQLTLTSETEEVLKHQPSVVIRANVCDVLRSFSRLACSVLQMLLPDLTINLFDALGDSYHDLLNLIDSVILSNSR